MPTKHPAEDHVRLYLQYLEDPDSLRDEAAITKAQAAVERAKDPIVKVKALTALERAQSLEPERFRDPFVANVKAWVESSDVSVSALQLIGVPDEDLIEAGLLAPAPVARRRRQATMPSAPAPGRRSPRIELSDVAAALPAREFRLAELAAAIGRESATTRNYVNKLIEQGIVAEVGDDPNHAGKGKAPKLYARA